MNNPSFAQNEIYHVFNRGVEKRKVFQHKTDFERFIFSLSQFNTPESVLNTARTREQSSLFEVKPRTNAARTQNGIEEDQKLVEIVAFALMPNHFHLLLRQLVDGGIPKFMQKVLTGYTMYFNKKNERVGSLFQGTYKAVLIERDAQFMYIPHYVHKNPIDTLKRGEKLENYPWSSYRDYAFGTNEYPFLNKELFLETFGGSNGYRKDFEAFDWKKKTEEEKDASFNVRVRG